jgi:HPt (histidine-containing phosphotransfer) domain-containing protein
MLDTDVLGELRALGDDDLRDLVGIYFADVALQLDNLRTALGAADGVAVGEAAHRVKGASLSIGAARVGSIASELEIAGKAGDFGRCDELLETLESELGPTRRALSAELSVELSG